MAKHSQVELELTGVHLCCQGCVNAADAALMSVEGVESRCDMENGTVSLTAGDDTAARKALDALAAAGFYGRTGNQNLTMKAMSDVPQGKVKRLKVSAIHNCCGLCCEAIKEAIATVDGVTGDTAEPQATTFEVIGDLDAAVLVKALNAAGFSAQVKQGKTTYPPSINV
jgi:periplasmic mercuric ion binding protein